MRQLKGKVKKENKKEKRERKKEFAESKDQVRTVVLPVCGVLLAVLIAFVLYNSGFKW